MAMNQNDIVTIGGTQVIIGLSQVVRVTPSAFQYSSAIKVGSGGSLEIVPIQLSGSSTAAGSAWGKGYLFGSGEVYSWNGPATMYFAATGATVVAHMTCGYTSGGTFL